MVYQSWLDFVEEADLESLELLPDAKLFVVPPVLPWYAPNQHELQTIALVMHYLTTQEANGYGVDDHTSNSLRTLGHLRSHCWQLVRQSIGDKGYFTNCIKLEVCPVAFPYGKEINHVFANQSEINGMMDKYSLFIKSVIDNVTKVHLCSKTVAAKVEKMYGGASSFEQYFLENRDRFFSLKEEVYETCCHPEALLNRGFWNQHITKHASGWDRSFTMMRLFCGDEAACTEADDMVDLKPGTAAHTLMMQKLKEQNERARERGKQDFLHGRRLFNVNHPKLVEAQCTNHGQRAKKLGLGFFNENYQKVLKEQNERARGKQDFQYGRRLFNVNHPKLVEAQCSNHGQRAVKLQIGWFSKIDIWKRTWCAKFDELTVFVNNLEVRMYPLLYEYINRHSLLITT